MKPISREQERQLIAFLANSDEVASLAASRLESRMTRRNQILTELATQLPAAEKACARAIADAAAPALALTKAREALARAQKAHDEATAHAASITNHSNGLKATAYRQASDLADPRIDDLRRWVLRLHNVVRAEPLEEVLKMPKAWGVGDFRTPGAPAGTVSRALDQLEAMAQGLADMLIAPYGPELQTTLSSKQLEAESIARTVIPAQRFDVLIEYRPDLAVLPLPPV
jgi:hypothetical protein